MKNQTEKSLRVAELAELVNGLVIGDSERRIRGVASLSAAGEGEIAFLEEAKFVGEAQSSKASCLIVPSNLEIEFPCAIQARRPKLAFALIARELHKPPAREPSIHPTAIIAESTRIDSSAYIGAYVRIGERTIIGAGTQIHDGVSIGANVSVGRDCVLHPRVTLYDEITIGERVILHAGVCIGADGFGYVRDEDGYHKFPQIGTVIIEDDVEIGAQSCVDRGALGRTRIGRGTKIDNLVQIAHNVEIGEHVVIAAQTGISGSTVIEDEAVIGGQVGMGDHARVERGAIIGSKAGILPGKIVRAGSVMWGVPVRPLDEYKKLNALWGRLPRIVAELEKLRQQVHTLLQSHEGQK